MWLSRVWPRFGKGEPIVYMRVTHANRVRNVRRHVAGVCFRDPRLEHLDMGGQLGIPKYASSQREKSWRLRWPSI